jgi:hypothetical protein
LVCDAVKLGTIVGESGEGKTSFYGVGASFLPQLVANLLFAHREGAEPWILARDLAWKAGTIPWYKRAALTIPFRWAEIVL